jgi:hypothetical protein
MVGRKISTTLAPVADGVALIRLLNEVLDAQEIETEN